LIQAGHPDPLSYSYDKLELFFKLATRRLASQQAQKDLRQMRLVRTAVQSIVDARALNHYKNCERALIEAMEPGAGGADNVERNRSNLIKRLIAAGATLG